MKYPINFAIGFKKHKYPGKLIAIEGTDGSGKTTQARELVEELKKRKIKVIYTKEPTDGAIGKLIRQILSGEIKVPPISLQYLFCADRAVHQEEVEKYLKKGYVVITDRYFWSAVAYGMSDLGGSADFYMIAFSILSMYSQFMSPDCTFFLDIDVSEAARRISKSHEHKEIYDNRTKLEKANDAYLKLVKRFKEEFVIVDGNKSIKEVKENLLALIDKEIQK